MNQLTALTIINQLHTSSHPYQNHRSSTKKLLEFYGTQRFISALTTARHFSVSWARWILSTLSNFIFVRVAYVFQVTFRLANQIAVRISLLPQTCHIPHPTRPPITPNEALPYTALSILHPILENLSPTFFPQRDKPSFSPITIGNITVFACLSIPSIWQPKQ